MGLGVLVPKAPGRAGFPSRPGSRTPVGVTGRGRGSPSRPRIWLGQQALLLEERLLGSRIYCRDLACDLADQSLLGKKCSLKQSLSRLDPRWLLF